jgi:hypothetical protein
MTAFLLKDRLGRPMPVFVNVLEGVDAFAPGARKNREPVLADRGAPLDS